MNSVLILRHESTYSPIYHEITESLSKLPRILAIFHKFIPLKVQFALI
jgi:hypothetical protein